MPFLDDTEPDESALQSPIWSVFTLAKDNLERLIAVNLFWSIQIFPALLALAFPALWLWLRILMLLTTATTLAASTGVLYGMVKHVCEYEPLSMDLFRDTFRRLAVPSMRKLAPLYGTWGVCMVCIVLGLYSGVTLLQILIYYIALLLITCSFYWGPLFADDPDESAWVLFKRSARLLWRYPGPTAISGLVILVILLTGVASVAGIVLIVPVLVALLQTRRYQEIAELERLRRRRVRERRERAMAAKPQQS